jgi:hypothetical protein
MKSRVSNSTMQKFFKFVNDIKCMFLTCLMIDLKTGFKIKIYNITRRNTNLEKLLKMCRKIHVQMDVEP